MVVIFQGGEHAKAATRSAWVYTCMLAALASANHIRVLREALVLPDATAESIFDGQLSASQ